MINNTVYSMHEAKHFPERWRDAPTHAYVCLHTISGSVNTLELVVDVRNSRITLTCPVAVNNLPSEGLLTTCKAILSSDLLWVSRLRVCIFIKVSACIQCCKGTYSMFIVYLFTYSASAVSPPRITDTSARSVTNTIFTRWEANSWRKKPTDSKVRR